MSKSAAKRPTKRKPTPAARRMAAYRQRMRAAGLKPVQIWMPDTKSSTFLAEARRQSLIIANTPDTDGDEIMKFIEATYEWPEYEWD